MCFAEPSSVLAFALSLFAVQLCIVFLFLFFFCFLVVWFVKVLLLLKRKVLLSICTKLLNAYVHVLEKDN